MSFLDTLNPTQKEAVTFGDGPLLILAGAGSGKTRVLTTRIAHLVLNRGVAPERILAVTFTNKAAGEMRERLDGLMGRQSRGLWLGTFHSLGLRILRKEAARLGGTGDEGSAQFTVYNDDDQLQLVRNVIRELGYNEKSLSPRAVLSRIDRAKNELIDPEQYMAQAGDFLSERVGRIYSLYQTRLREMNALDFGDLICEPLRLFRSNPQVLAHYSDRFRYVLVDEYQDTNQAQYAMLSRLSDAHGNICAVGDPDQSIYAWRGADIQNILDFTRDWPKGTVLRLEQNYRSTKFILNAANSVIRNNQGRMEKTLWTENPDGVPVVCEEGADEREEAEIVTRRLKGLMDEKDMALGFSDFAVFYRTNAQSRVFEEHFIRQNVPYTIVGGVRFYDRREIRDALAYLRVAHNPADEISLRRVINTPTRGIGQKTLAAILALSVELGVTPLEGLKEAFGRGIIKKSGGRKLIEGFDSFRHGSRELPLHERSLRLLEDTGYMEMWLDEGTEDARERVENLHELISAIKDFERSAETPTLGEFLDQVALIADVDTYEDKLNRVTLMTLHSAKGLEFPVVFMAGMEEELFPHRRSFDDPAGMEEERRLCYVGMTRARTRLFVCSAASRTVFGNTRFQTRSRFIDEIDDEFIEAPSGCEPVLPGRASTRQQSQSNDEPYYTSEESQVEDFDGAGGAGGGGETGLRVGMKVRHPSFGMGMVKAKEGSGEEMKVTVNFFGFGRKKLMLKYASLVLLP